MPGPAQPDRIPPVAEQYAGRRIAVLTQHRKERGTSPMLNAALGCQVQLANRYDTDLLGTFTREIPREGTQLEAARK